MKITTIILSILMLIKTGAQTGDGKIEMPSVFSDNMVLQQNSLVSFWGKAGAGLTVKINASWGESADTKVNSDGTWLAKIKTPTAGGPFEINLQIGDSTILYKNVLTGEVWICSGQSNMEMPLEGWPPNDTIFNSAQEISTANYSKIRFFTVSRAFSNEKEFNCKGTWEECSPATASKFSATAFFFGKKLFNELNVPVGLINTSWGGTAVEPWISEDYLGQVEEYKPILQEIKNSSLEILKYNEWLFAHPSVDVSSRTTADKWKNLDFNDKECTNINFSDVTWKEMNLPCLWESTEIGNFDGVVWFRKKIEIPDEWLNKDLVLELGPIDDIDITYVNGTLVGSIEESGFWQTDRIYKIPKGINNKKDVLIAVRVLDNQGGGGIYGVKEKLKIHPENSDQFISLSGNWKYHPVGQFRDQKIFVFGVNDNDYYSRPSVKINLSAYTPTALYNGMISPLIPYSIKGAIWYQGESNAGRPGTYTNLFSLMIKNWRTDWNIGEFPFYYVQIAPYNYGENTHSEKLREAQLKTLSVPNTGMAVTLDIGSPKTIHPGNKKDVGERLAAWALAKTYEKEIPFSGPLYKSMKVEDNKITLSFDYAGDSLIIKEKNGENNFMIAGEDKIFKKAFVNVEGDKLILSNAEVKNPAAVRYAWNNTSEATLFNNDGLPASSFRTDNWDE